MDRTQTSYPLFHGESLSSTLVSIPELLSFLNYSIPKFVYKAYVNMKIHQILKSNKVRRSTLKGCISHTTVCLKKKLYTFEMAAE